MALAGGLKTELLSRDWRVRLLLLDKAVTILIIVLLGVYKPDYVVIAAFFLVIPYLVLTQRKMLLKHLGVSALVAFAWMLIAKREYGYNQDFLIVGGINLFPLFGWAVSLFIVYLIYSHYERLIHKQHYLAMILLFAAFYLPLLIGVETIAYHLFNIRNVAASAYIGLPLCDCIHAPPWMQLSYLLLGPLYFSICYVLKLENPHRAQKLHS